MPDKATGWLLQKIADDLKKIKGEYGLICRRMQINKEKEYWEIFPR